MRIDVEINFDLNNIQFEHVCKIGMTNSLNKIQEEARRGAPHESGNLRRSIGTEPSSDFLSGRV
jgi:hypothetical protein